MASIDMAMSSFGELENCKLIVPRAPKRELLDREPPVTDMMVGAIGTRSSAQLQSAKQHRNKTPETQNPADARESCSWNACGSVSQIAAKNTAFCPANLDAAKSGMASRYGTVRKGTYIHVP